LLALGRRLLGATTTTSRLLTTRHFSRRLTMRFARDRFALFANILIVIVLVVIVIVIIIVTVLIAIAILVLKLTAKALHHSFLI